MLRFLTAILWLAGTKRVYRWDFPPLMIVIRSPTMPALPLTRTTSLAFLWNGVTTCANRILCRNFFRSLACLDLIVLATGFEADATTGPDAPTATACWSVVGDGMCEDGGPSALVTPGVWPSEATEKSAIVSRRMPSLTYSAITSTFVLPELKTSIAELPHRSVKVQRRLSPSGSWKVVNRAWYGSRVTVALG